MPRRVASNDPTTPTPDVSQPSFEEAMGELESIVQAMDDDSLALESLLTHYSRGKQLLKFCQNQIQDAQQRVELINAQADGSATLEPFAASSPPPPQSRSVSTASSTVSENEDDIQFS